LYLLFPHKCLIVFKGGILTWGAEEGKAAMAFPKFGVERWGHQQSLLVALIMSL
jgi:hypothetical protein